MESPHARTVQPGRLQDHPHDMWPPRRSPKRWTHMTVRQTRPRTVAGDASPLPGEYPPRPSQDPSRKSRAARRARATRRIPTVRSGRADGSDPMGWVLGWGVERYNYSRERAAWLEILSGLSQRERILSLLFLFEPCVTRATPMLGPAPRLSNFFYISFPFCSTLLFKTPARLLFDWAPFGSMV